MKEEIDEEKLEKIEERLLQIGAFYKWMGAEPVIYPYQFRWLIGAVFGIKKKYWWEIAKLLKERGVISHLSRRKVVINVEDVSIPTLAVLKFLLEFLRKTFPRDQVSRMLALLEKQSKQSKLRL